MNLISYELWDGAKVVGYYSTKDHLMGNYLIIPIRTTKTGRIKTIKIPVCLRQINEMDYRICLNVKRKSRKQIELIKFLSPKNNYL